MNHNTKYYKVNIFISLGFLILFIIVLFLSFFSILDTEEGLSAFTMMSVLFCLPFLIMFIYYIIRYNYYKRVELKYIQKVKLEKTYPFFNRMSGFVISMNINGSMKKIDTKAIYSSSMFTILSLDEFIGEVVEVGYDEKNDVAVIIK